MASFYYRLPWPPSVNNYWATRRLPNGKPMKYLTVKAKEFRKAVIDAVHQQGGAHVTGLPLAVSIELVPPTKRRFDIDNFCKSTIDAIMHAGCFVDDSQIVDLRVKRLHVEAPGCADVTITELNGTGE